MALVTRDDECQASYRNLIIISSATSTPGVVFEAVKKRYGRAAHILVFFRQIFEAPFVEVSASNEVVLFETRQWGFVAAGKS